MKDVVRYAPKAAGKREPIVLKLLEWMPPYEASDIRGVRTPMGKEIAGNFVMVPLMPSQFLNLERPTVIDRVKRAALLGQELGAQIEVPEYKSGFRKGADPIFILGAQLSTFINNRTYKADQDVAIIGHSMGGVVSRASLVESLRDRERHYARFVKLVVTVASPLGGTWLGSLAGHIPGKFKVMKQAAELSANSSTLAETKQWWGQWVKENTHLVDNVRSVYSLDDKVVPINSAIGEDRNAVCIAGASHSDIVKPKSADDEIARTLLRFAAEAKIE